MSTTVDEPKKRFFRDSKLVRAIRFIVHNTGLDKFAFRFGLICVILFSIYNPTRWCYVNWIFPGGPAPVKAWIGSNMPEILMGILLLSAIIYLVRTTDKALGHLGTMLVGAGLLSLFGLFAWNVEVAWTGSLLITLGELGVAVIFTAGLLAANLNRRISGQITTVQAGPVDTHSIDHHGG